MDCGNKNLSNEALFKGAIESDGINLFLNVETSGETYINLDCSNTLSCSAFFRSLFTDDNRIRIIEDS
jgi:hypothetical protein